MDDPAHLSAYAQALRIQYRVGTGAPNVAGLRALHTALFQALGGVADTVAITSMSFEAGQGTGTLTLSLPAKLQAVQTVLAEVDPAVAAAQPPSARFANFSAMCTET